MRTVRFGVLGPLAVTTRTGEPVTVPGAKVRVLLSALLAGRNRVVPVDRLVEDVWGGGPVPDRPVAALQVRVSQLRKALDDAEPGARELVESHRGVHGRGGYLLRTTATDADRFTELTAADDPDRLAEALALWRGEPYADTADRGVGRAEAAELTERRLSAQERLAEHLLARGEHDAVAADLAGLVARHPLAERLRAVQLRALDAAGRRSEALAGYAEIRARLADELGLDPGPELTELHRRLLDGDGHPARVPGDGLPAPVDELVGRDDALAELHRLLPDHRLVTLVGPGGVGKTRLAVEAARGRPGVRLVELAGLPAGADAGSVADRVLAAFDVREASGAHRTATRRLVAALCRRADLIVLDNCEHVPAAADVVAAVLRECPRIRVLATGREPLGITGERIWDVPTLAVPAADAGVHAVRSSPAARLFAARAAAGHRTFVLDEHTAAAVAQLCRRLDGLPLALELAATRVRTLGVAGVLDRLDDRFALLRTAQRDRPARQRTLAAVLAWSWDLLDEGDRQVLARLAVVAGGCTAAAATAIGDTDTDGLARLVDRSLVVVDDVAGCPRYRLLESVAAFAIERLEEPDRARARHAAHYTELAERADAALRGPAQREWLERLEAESANLRAALAYGGGARLANALTWYWFLRGRHSEARRALAATGGDPGWLAGFALLQGVGVDRAAPPDGLRGRVAWFVAHGMLDRSELTRAARLLDDAESDARGDGDVWTEAAVYASRAMLAHAAGDLSTLDSASRRSTELFTDVGDAWGLLQAGAWRAGLAEMRGEYDRAGTLLAEGLGQARELGLWPEVGNCLAWMAWLAVQTGDHDRARELGERALRMAHEHDSPSAVAFAELGLGFAARAAGAPDVAGVHLERLVEMAGRETEPALYLPMVLLELGHVDREAGDPATARERYRHALALAREMGAGRDEQGALEALAALDPVPG